MELNRIISRTLWMFLVTQTIHLGFGLALASSGNETDRLSLLAFKARVVSDPFDVLSSWNDSSNFCNWVGVACGRRHQRIIELNLQSYALAGTLSPHIGNLSFLRILNLQNNSLTQDIPEELGHLFGLRDLILENNSFTGRIPVGLSNCSDLRILNFGGNKLVSEVPSELGSLLKLQSIVFERNVLDGSIPSSLGNLSSLVEIRGSQNRLSGGVPEDLGNLKNLCYGIVKLSSLIRKSDLIRNVYKVQQMACPPSM